MYKDASYKEKCQVLAPWMVEIIDAIKKDIKNDHLKQDFGFVKNYFAGKNINKLTKEELASAYLTAIEKEEKSEELAEFICSRWMINNSEVYGYFETALSKISEDFTALTAIEPKKAEEIVQGASKEFGSLKAYIFSVMNSVVFPKETFTHLEKQVKEDQAKLVVDEKAKSEAVAYDQLKKQCEADIAKLVDKYEKKLAGLIRKYQIDTEGLKKQIAALQKKMKV